jgi:hypothetical protein
VFRFKEFWLGLFSSEGGVVANVWERDCSLQNPRVQRWDSSIGEPNYLDTDRCIRWALL